MPIRHPVLAALLLGTALSACMAPGGGTTLGTLTFRATSCETILAEARRVSAEAVAASGKAFAQATEADGLVELPWPDVPEPRGEVRPADRLRGEMTDLRRESMERECPIAFRAIELERAPVADAAVASPVAASPGARAPSRSRGRSAWK